MLVVWVRGFGAVFVGVMLAAEVGGSVGLECSPLEVEADLSFAAAVDSVDWWASSPLTVSTVSC
jgi:hypothetical protein